ncbi:MAG: hypothetical protein HY975_03085, partial [Candidatus Kerfeldbacteria bacterium]|nr:hypothetical protein [Candidatus Kerfeldbacteria bacterium]
WHDAALTIYDDYRRRHIRVRRPSIVWAFCCLDQRWFTRAYTSGCRRREQRLQQERRQKRESQRESERRRREEERLNNGTAELRQRIQQLLQIHGSSVGWTETVRQLIKRASDPDLQLHVRWAAFFQAETAVTRPLTAGERQSPITTDLTYEERLWQAVMTVNVENLDNGHRERFDDALADCRHSRDGLRTSEKRLIRLLERWLIIAERSNGNGVAASTAVVVDEEPSPTSGPVLTSLDHVVPMLKLEEILPPDIDAEYVGAIIVFALLQPGRTDAAAFNAAYHQEHSIRRMTRNKIGERFNMDVYRATLRWLQQNHVVVNAHGKRGRELWGLNSHRFGKKGPKRVEPPTEVGRLIIERVIKLDSDLRQMLRK